MPEAVRRHARVLTAQFRAQHLQISPRPQNIALISVLAFSAALGSICSYWAGRGYLSSISVNRPPCSILRTRLDTDPNYIFRAEESDE
jgi:hypothetical protein